MQTRFLAPMNEPLSILLVEDDPGDVMLAEEALAASKLSTHLHVVSDGEEALAYLRGEGDHEGSSRPDLMLLDLNLPKKSGHEVLAEIKADPALRRIPVVVLTTSKSQEDVVRSYDLHASVHVSKPIDFDAFTSVIGQIDEFFGSLAELEGR